MTDHLLVTRFPDKAKLSRPIKHLFDRAPRILIPSFPSLEIREEDLDILPPFPPIDGTRCKFEIARWRPNFERKNRSSHPFEFENSNVEERKGGEGSGETMEFLSWGTWDKNLTFLLPSFLPSFRGSHLTASSSNVLSRKLHRKGAIPFRSS